MSSANAQLRPWIDACLRAVAGRRGWAWLLSLAMASPLAAQTSSMLDATVTQVAVVGYHTCALSSTGAVTCWGYNGYGQLGDGSTAARTTPVAVSGLGSGVAAIAAGFYHTCALTTAGAVKCWGRNDFGQLGNGSTTNSATPVVVSGLGSGVAAIAAGAFHTCALTTAGAVKCWGYNGNGQLGDGSTTDRSTPVAVSGLGSDVAAIAAGFNHTCAVTTAGAVKCWGWNYYGQLGDGSTTSRTTPVAVSGLSSGMSAIAAGVYHTCALTTGGSVKCWGSNVSGQLGDGSNTDHDTPVAVSGLGSGVAAIAAGGYHTCALTTAIVLKCWGSNSNGQLGNASTSDSNTPVNVLDGVNYLPVQGVAAIAAGYSHTCTLSAAGAVKCWGNNVYGQLGDGSVTDRVTPVAVSGLSSGVAAIAAGGHHTCVLTTAGAVKCWGGNDFGQLGDGSATDRTTPVVVSGLGSGVAAITAGSNHTCALTTAGAVKCWGFNLLGEIGDGSTTNRSTPVAVSGLSSGVAAIAAGREHTCALTTAGAVKCWGDNYAFQLGDGSTTNRTTPVAVSGLNSDVAAITAGAGHTCALTTAGALKCWGSNVSGQLGDGSTTSRSTPVAVSGLSSGVAAISAGYSHTCALSAAGALKCWGWNSNGQLGDGSTTNRTTPVAVSGLNSGMSAIAAGSAHNCALTTAGVLTCWGLNSSGQLGDGSTTDRSTPVAVSGLGSGVGAIEAGGIHTCALTTAGALRCWGGNGYGQLGNGGTLNQYVPVSIQIGQSVAFAPSARMGFGNYVSVFASASSGMPVAFDTWTPSTCTFSAGKLVLTNTGLCGLRASQAGEPDGTGGTFAAAPQQLRLIRVEADLIFANGVDSSGGLSW
ncbi:MAG: RCC1 repeat-containing protein [Proteobacteria bacterium]|nr:RCC1 repeat-containing protein [Pseudomonadota bacterium]